MSPLSFISKSIKMHRPPHCVYAHINNNTGAQGVRERGATEHLRRPTTQALKKRHPCSRVTHSSCKLSKFPNSVGTDSRLLLDRYLHVHKQINAIPTHESVVIYLQINQNALLSSLRIRANQQQQRNAENINKHVRWSHSLVSCVQSPNSDGIEPDIELAPRSLQVRFDAGKHVGLQTL